MDRKLFLTYHWATNEPTRDNGTDGVDCVDETEDIYAVL